MKSFTIALGDFRARGVYSRVYEEWEVTFSHKNQRLGERPTYYCTEMADAHDTAMAVLYRYIEGCKKYGTSEKIEYPIHQRDGILKENNKILFNALTIEEQCLIINGAAYFIHDKKYRGTRDRHIIRRGSGFYITPIK